MSVKASIGVAVLAGVDNFDGIAEGEAEELVREDDRAMYRAKGEGGRATRSPTAGDPRPPAPIQRSAWEGYSPKFGCRILRKTT